MTTYLKYEDLFTAIRQGTLFYDNQLILSTYEVYVFGRNALTLISLLKKYDIEKNYKRLSDRIILAPSVQDSEV